MNNPTTTPSPETTAATAAANHCRIFTDQPNLPTSTPLLLKPAASAAGGDELRRFRISLKWCLLEHSSPAGRLLSYAAFALLALFVPALAALSVRDDEDDAAAAADPVHLNKLVQFPLSGLALAAFLALAPGGRLRHLLLLLGLDASADTGHSLRRRHAAELDRAFRRLALILFPSLLAELAHKLVFFSSVSVAAPNGVVFPLNPVLFVLVVASWVYRSGVFLLVCVMFRLTCELQILRFEGFQRMLEVGGETASCWEIFREHLRIRKQLGVTSHRYRFFIIWSLFIITVSQFGALLLVLGSKTEKNFLNSGDLVVSIY